MTFRTIQPFGPEEIIIFHRPVACFIDCKVASFIGLEEGLALTLSDFHTKFGNSVC